MATHGNSPKRRLRWGTGWGAGLKNTLTAVQIKKAGDGKLFDGGGLSLVKTGAAGKWVYRFSHLGKRREMGLGAWPTVSLAEARRARDAWAAELAAGRDPISVRDAKRASEIADRDKADPTMADAVTLVFEARKAGLRGDGARGRWRSPLDLHVLPVIGRKRLSELHQTDIKDTLAPIWRTKHPTAIKAIERLRIVMREAQIMGYDCTPVTVDAARRMLGEVRHVAEPTPSTPWQKIPALYARLPDSVAGECLRLMILTLVRMDGCRGARIEEIDGDLWTVPPDRIKGREGRVREFRVPLSAEAQRIMGRAMVDRGGLLFASYTGRAITSSALEKAMREAGEDGRPHGLRTSFRTWVQDTDACGYEVAETVLGHAIGNKVERSYARSDLLDRRRIVMDAWAAFVTGAEENVVPMKRSAGG